MGSGVKLAFFLLMLIGCQKVATVRTPLSTAGERVAVLVDRPGDNYLAVGDLVATARARQKNDAITEATDSLRNQAAEHGAGMIYIQRVDAEVDWRESVTLVKVFATAYKNEP